MDQERRTLPRCVVHADPTVMSRHDARHEVQSEPRTGGALRCPAAEELMEQLGKLLWRYALAVVGHTQSEGTVGLCPHTQINTGVGRGVSIGVFKQVAQHDPHHVWR